MKDNNLQNFLVICGILVPILSLVVYTVLGVIKTDYNPLLQTISELGEEGGPNAHIASAFFIISGILLALFSIGLYINLHEYKGGKIGPILLLIFSIFDSMGSGIFPCDENCAGHTFSGMMHMVVSIIGLLAIWFAPLMLWRSTKEQEEWQNVNSIFLMLAIAIVILGGLFIIVFLIEIYIGLFQRILYSFILAWIFILASKLFLIVRD